MPDTHDWNKPVETLPGLARNRVQNEANTRLTTLPADVPYDVARDALLAEIASGSVGGVAAQGVAKLSGWIDAVLDHGAVPGPQEGAAPATNSGPAIEAAMAAAWSAGDPVTVSRYAKKVVYIPPGRYRVDGWLQNTRGGSGSVLVGAGMGQTILEFYSNPVQTGTITSSTESVVTTNLTTTASQTTTGSHAGRFMQITSGSFNGLRIPIASNTLGANAQFTTGCDWTSVSLAGPPPGGSTFEIVDPACIEIGGTRGGFISGITIQPASGAYLYGMWHVWKRPTTFPRSPERTATSSNENTVEECEVVASTPGILRRVGFAAGYEGRPGAEDQADSVVWRRCKALGTYDVSQPDQTTHTQIGFQAGGGIYANPVCYTMDDCIASGFRTLAMCNAGDLRIEGGTWQSCRYVLGFNGASNYVEMSSLRLELCGYLVKSFNAFEITAGLSIRNVTFNLDAGYYDPDSTGRWIEFTAGAPLVLENIKTSGPLGGKRVFIYAPGAGQAGLAVPNIVINGAQLPEYPWDALGGIGRFTDWKVYDQATNQTLVSFSGVHTPDGGTQLERGHVSWSAGASQPDVRVGRWGAGIFGVGGQIVTGSRGVRVQKLGTPAAPVLTNVSGTGATSWRYRHVCKDAHGRRSAAGTAATITGPATLRDAGSEYLWIAGPVTGFPIGTVSYDVLREEPFGSGTYRSIFLGIPVERQLVKDNGIVSSAYTLPAADETGGGFSAEPHSLTWSGSITIDARLGNSFEIVATTGIATTIQNPTSAVSGQLLEIELLNSSGGAMGAITWGSELRLAGAFTNPANGMRRSIAFRRNAANTLWIERSRAAADIA